MFARVNENLKRVFLTDNYVFTYAASETGAFEGAVQNLFSPAISGVSKDGAFWQTCSYQQILTKARSGPVMDRTY